jgi:hypothetical protein
MEYVRICTYVYLSVSWQYSNSTVAVGKYVCTARFFVMGPRPHLSLYSREHIKALLQGGASTAEIVDTLKQEGIVTCRQIVWRFQCHFEKHGIVAPLPKLGR